MKKKLKEIESIANNFLEKHRVQIQYSTNNKTASKMVRQYKIPPLKDSEIKEIDEYWANYGVKFKNYDFYRMYYAITGIKDPRFLPHPFANLVLYRYYNDMTQVRAYADKNMFYRIMPGMRFPELIGQRINGRYYDWMGRYYGDGVTYEYTEILFQYIQDHSANEIILKEASGSSTGKGVKKERIKDVQSLFSVLNSNNSLNYVIQFVIKQHPFFQQFNESSVNIVRLNTWRCGNEVHVLCPCIRFGIPGAATDVAYVNGIEIVNCVGVSKQGVIFDKGVGIDGKKIELSVLEKRVPCWNQIVDLVRKNHLTMDYFDIIAWDITVDENSNVICIEYNLRSPGSIVYQFAHGPFAGDHTDEMLGFLKDKNNQKKYLPKNIRRN